MTCNGEHEAPPCADPQCWRGIDPVLANSVDQMAARVRSKIGRLQARVAELEENLRAVGSIESSVNSAINRAGIYCAITFAEAIDQIRTDRDIARVERDAAIVECRNLGADIRRMCGTMTLADLEADRCGRALADKLQVQRDEARAAKDGAYNERDRCVAALAWLAHRLGWEVGIGEHDPNDRAWDAEWRTIVFIMFPTGQASWHIHDSEVDLVRGLPTFLGTWDGHTTPEKYERVRLGAMSR